MRESELEQISLRNLVPHLAAIATLAELKQFIEEKLMPLFQFGHYVYQAGVTASGSVLELSSLPSPAGSDNAENSAFLKSLQQAAEGMQVFPVKARREGGQPFHTSFAAAYAAQMKEAVVITLSRKGGYDHWLLFGSRKQFFNTHKLELFRSLCLLCGMAAAQCVTVNAHIKPLAAAVAVQEPNPVPATGLIVGDGPAMQQVKLRVQQVAPTDSTVLILGETGTGKELIARAIHEHSKRKDQALIIVNCAALPAELIESELFGHEKGAFTGATERKTGKFELADKGTLFLDEIGELPAALQAKLLRALQEQVIERVGGHKSLRVNVRIIAATNRNLEAEVRAGRFRGDLYYRLHVFPIGLPALRERKEDIAALSLHFVQQFAAKFGIEAPELAPQVQDALEQYYWPGNIRELEHTIERSLLLHKGKVLKQVHFTAAPAVPGETPASGSGAVVLTLKEMERAYILRAIRQCRGKVSGKQGAAQLLGLPATTLFSRMEKLGIRKSLLSQEADS